MKTYLDFMGREISLGDILITDRSSYRGLELDIAVGFTDKYIKLGKGGYTDSRHLLIVTDFLDGDRAAEAHEMMEKYKDKIEKAKSKPIVIKPKWKYFVFILKDIHGNEFVRTAKIDCRTFETYKGGFNDFINAVGCDSKDKYVQKCLYNNTNRHFGKTPGLMFILRNMSYSVTSGHTLRNIGAWDLYQYLDRSISLDDFAKAHPDITLC